eukprot:gene1272-5859_t
MIALRNKAAKQTTCPTCNNSGAAGSGRFRQIDLEMQRCAALNLFNLKRSTISRSYKAGVHSETEEMEKQLHFAFVDALPVLTTALLLKPHVPVAACQRNALRCIVLVV